MYNKYILLSLNKKNCLLKLTDENNFNKPVEVKFRLANFPNDVLETMGDLRITNDCQINHYGSIISLFRNFLTVSMNQFEDGNRYVSRETFEYLVLDYKRLIGFILYLKIAEVYFHNSKSKSYNLSYENDQPQQIKIDYNEFMNENKKYLLNYLNIIHSILIEKVKYNNNYHVTQSNNNGVYVAPDNTCEKTGLLMDMFNIVSSVVSANKKYRVITKMLDWVKMEIEKISHKLINDETQEPPKINNIPKNILSKLSEVEIDNYFILTLLNIKYQNIDKLELQPLVNKESVEYVSLIKVLESLKFNNLFVKLSECSTIVTENMTYIEFIDRYRYVFQMFAFKLAKSVFPKSFMKISDYDDIHFQQFSHEIEKDKESGVRDICISKMKEKRSIFDILTKFEYEFGKSSGNNKNTKTYEIVREKVIEVALDILSATSNNVELIKSIFNTRFSRMYYENSIEEHHITMNNFKYEKSSFEFDLNIETEKYDTTKGITISTTYLAERLGVDNCEYIIKLLEHDTSIVSLNDWVENYVRKQSKFHLNNGLKPHFLFDTTQKYGEDLAMEINKGVLNTYINCLDLLLHNDTQTNPNENIIKLNESNIEDDIHIIYKDIVEIPYLYIPSKYLDSTKDKNIVRINLFKIILNELNKTDGYYKALFGGVYAMEEMVVFMRRNLNN